MFVLLSSLRYLLTKQKARSPAVKRVPHAFVPAACGLVCGSEVVKDLLRKAGVYRGKK